MRVTSRPHAALNRFVLADTDRLHAKITEMSERIRQLEEALAHGTASGSGGEHPLLTRELRNIKSVIDLHSAIEKAEADEADEDSGDGLDIFGTLAVREDGASTFYGRSAGQEVRRSYVSLSPRAR
jgi:hypothetical protein